MTVALIAVPTLRHHPSLVPLITCLADAAAPSCRVLVVRSGVAPGEPWPDHLPPLPHGASALPVAERGAARARQAALEHAARAGADVVLFIDDDCRPEPDWAEALLGAMGGGVAAAGGAIAVEWPAGQAPRWLPPSMAVLYGERHAGLSCPHRPFGANMALRVEPALEAGGFATELGPVGTTPALHEETELCESLAAAGYDIAEAPAAAVWHRVTPGQATRRWLWRRTWHEGRSDARRDRRRGTLRVAPRLLRLSGLVVLLPLSLLHRRTTVYVVGRALSHAGFLAEISVYTWLKWRQRLRSRSATSERSRATSGW